MSAYAAGKYLMSLFVGRGPTINIMRHLATTKALEDGADYILHLDADEIYPEDTPEWLMKHMSDEKMVVAGLCADRTKNSSVTFDFTDESPRVQRRPLKPNGGLVQVDVTGLGGVMTDPKIYKLLGESYFEGLKGYGDDISFCYNCKQKNIPIWCDTDLQFGHIVSIIKYP